MICYLPDPGVDIRLAPHPNESGQKVGYRRVRCGRADITPYMFIVTLAAVMRKQFNIANAKLEKLEQAG